MWVHLLGMGLTRTVPACTVALRLSEPVTSLVLSRARQHFTRVLLNLDAVADLGGGSRKQVAGESPANRAGPADARLSRNRAGQTARQSGWARGACKRRVTRSRI